MYSFDIPPLRTGKDSIKWNRDAIWSISANPDAEPFWVADMDFSAPPAVIRKAEEAAGRGVYGYPSGGCREKVFSSWLERKHNWKPEPESIVFSMGLLHGIASAIDLFTEKGDRIIVPVPAYRPFREICTLSGRVMVELELDYSQGRFSLDPEKLEKAASDASAILFCSPHNPSGIVFTRDELEGVLRTARKYNITVISDEIHADLVHPGRIHIPMGKANENIGAEAITFMAPSKTFNLAGEHFAWAVFSDKKMRDRWKKREEALFLTSPGIFIGDMAEAAYTEADEYNRELCEYLKRNSDYIESFFEEHKTGIRKVKGDSSFVTFLDCSEIYPVIEKKVLGDPERYHSPEGGILSRFFGVEAGVCMNDGSWFGEQYKAFVRFNYGTNLEAIKKALERIENAVKRIL